MRSVSDTDALTQARPFTRQQLFADDLFILYGDDLITDLLGSLLMRNDDAGHVAQLSEIL